MQVETSYLGCVEVKEEQLCTFEGGLPGFPTARDYVLVPFGEDNFYLLQSLQSKHIAFVCVNPFILWSDYELELDDSTILQLGIEKEAHVAVYVMLTIQQPFSETTANLRAPIVFHTINRKAKQLMLDAETYSPKAMLTATLKGGS